MAADDGSDEFVSQIDDSQPVVLFKIHNVKPIKNRDGKITDCEFSATFFNRSQTSVDNALINVNWKDEAISNVIEDEKEAALKKIQEHEYGLDSRPLPMDVSTTEKTTPIVLTASLKVPALKPYRQVSLRSKVSSDRCFLMINDATFKVENCSISNAARTGVVSPTAGKASCESLFKFVSAQDPEYYREFKKVSFNAERKAKQDALVQEQKSLTTLYDEAVSDINKAMDIMGQIK